MMKPTARRIFFLFMCMFVAIFSPTHAEAATETANELRVRGYQAQERGALEEAADFYRRAIAADSSYATPHNDLGILYEDLGRLQDAEREYRAAIQLDSNYAAAYTNLASLYDRQGRFADALPQWKRRSELGNPGDRWRKQAEDRVRELEAQQGIVLSAEPVSAAPSASPAPFAAPAESTSFSAPAAGEDSDLAMAQSIADLLVQEQEQKSGGAMTPPVGYTTVSFAPADEARSTSGDWYQRTPEALEDLTHEEEEVAKLGPEAHANFLIARARYAISSQNYQKAVDLLNRARTIDPDNIQIDKAYEDARRAQIEDDIDRASIDTSIYNRRKITEVEQKWFPPTPEAVEPFDSSKYIVQGSKKSEARLELERRAKQIIPSIDFTDAKLSNVIEFLAVSSDINIVIDEESVPPNERVTVHLKKIPLDEALGIILRTKGLQYRLEENIIWITSEARLKQENLEVRVYDVQDLVGKLYDFPSKPFDFEKIIQTKSEPAAK